MARIGNDNISVIKVRNTLDHDSLSVASLCRSSKVNVWSRNKPVVLSDAVASGIKNEGKSLSDFEGWQKGKNGMFGFTVPSTTNHWDIKEDGLNWGYTYPTDPPYTLEFFAGYDSAAVPFVRSLYKKGDSINVNSDTISEYVFIMMTGVPGSASSSINMSDFAGTAIGETYLTALFYLDDFGTSCIASSEKTVAEGGSNVKIDISMPPFSEKMGADLVNYKVYFCFCSRRYIQTETDRAGTFYPIPWSENSYYVVDFNINNKFDIVMTSDYIGRSVTPTTLFFPLSNYIHSSPVPGSTNYFYTNNPIYFKIEVWSDAGDYMMHSAYLGLEYKSFHNTLENITPALYDSRFNKIDHITLTSEKKTIYIGADYMMLLKNGINTLLLEKVEMFTIIAIRYKTTLVFSTPLNVTNRSI